MYKECIKQKNDLTKMFDGIKQYIKSINRILIEPKNVLLRTIDIYQHPYTTIVNRTPLLIEYYQDIAVFLGFIKHNHVYIQTKDNFYLKIGIEYLSTAIEQKLNTNSLVNTIEIKNNFQPQQQE